MTTPAKHNTNTRQPNTKKPIQYNPNTRQLQYKTTQQPTEQEKQENSNNRLHNTK